MNSYFAYIAPTLIMLLIISKIISKTSRDIIKKNKVFILITSAFILLLPIFNISFIELILSFNPVFSIGSLAMFSYLLLKNLGYKNLFLERDFYIFYIFNIVIGIILYSSFLGNIGIDIYYMGYDFSIIFVLLALITFISIILKSPLGYLFLLYILAFNIRLLPTDNLFDYIIDAPLFIISIVMLIFILINRFKNKSKTKQEII